MHYYSLHVLLLIVHITTHCMYYSLYNVLQPTVHIATHCMYYYSLYVLLLWSIDIFYFCRV